jgi:hypothetical protein
MTPDEIKAKSAELAAFYTAKANGKTLQVEYSDGWKNWVEDNGPTMGSDLSRWRVKPEPRRMWVCGESTTIDRFTAENWKSRGYKVTQFVEVLP